MTLASTKPKRALHPAEILGRWIVKLLLAGGVIIGAILLLTGCQSPRVPSPLDFPPAAAQRGAVSAAAVVGPPVPVIRRFTVSWETTRATTTGLDQTAAPGSGWTTVATFPAGTNRQTYAVTVTTTNQPQTFWRAWTK